MDSKAELVTATVGLAKRQAVYEGRGGSRSTLAAEGTIEVDGFGIADIAVWGRLSTSDGKPAVSFDVSIPKGLRFSDRIHAAMLTAVNSALAGWPHWSRQKQSAFERLTTVQTKTAAVAAAKQSQGLGDYVPAPKLVAPADKSTPPASPAK